MSKVKVIVQHEGEKEIVMEGRFFVGAMVTDVDEEGISVDTAVTGVGNPLLAYKMCDNIMEAILGDAE